MIKKEKAVVRRVEGREWWRVFLMFTFDHSMNSPDTVTHSKSHYAFLRLFLTLVFSFLAFFFTLLFIALLALLFDQFSDPSSTSLPSLCKIVSSSVDIRSSKVCELGLFNYKAKRVFYPFHTSKFRCRYDYYWASIFKVEYRDHSLGETRLALSEAPNEALPIDCRPNFGAALLTKHKFKVNKTYDCWYTSGVSKVSLYQDSFFSCHANHPSMSEIITQYLFLLSKVLSSWFGNKRRAKYWGWASVAGGVAGFLTSFMAIIILKLIKHIISGMVSQRHYTIICCRRACFLAVYLSVMCWLAVQYLKRLGLHIFPSL